MGEDYLSLLVAKKIQDARKGDTDAAKWLLKEFCASVATGKDVKGKPLRGPSGLVNNVRPAVLDYLAECFQLILSGVKADKALGTKKGESGAPLKPRNKTLDRNVLLCAEVMALRNTVPKPKLRDAFRRVASKHKGVSTRAVETAWKDKSANLAAELSTHLKQGK